MNILVVGAGLLGRAVAESLDSIGHDVAIIEEQSDKLQLLSPDFDGVEYIGFPLDLNALRNAGIEDCDVVAVTTSDDNLNITVGQIAKNYFNIKTVVARISDPYREHIFERFGLKTVCPTNMAGEKIVDAIVNPLQSAQVNFGSSTVSLYEQRAGKAYVGMTVSQIEEKAGTFVFAIEEQNGVFKFRSELTKEIIVEDDVIIFCKKID